MKKMLIATLLSGFAFGVAGAFGGCCGEVAPRCEIPTPPICTKAIKVPKTVYETKFVEVPAIRIECPQKPLVEYIPQPPRKIVYHQPPIQRPDVVCYEHVPCKAVCKPQPPIIRYACPVGTRENPGDCAARCA